MPTTPQGTGKKSKPKTKACPDNMLWLQPYLVVKDVKAIVAFYEKAFGFIKEEVIEGKDGECVHAQMHYKAHPIMIGRESASYPLYKTPTTLGANSITLYLYIEDVDSFFHKAIEAGAKAIQEPKDEYWGDRVCVLGDPDGHLWTFATHLKETKPTVSKDAKPAAPKDAKPAAPKDAKPAAPKDAKPEPAKDAKPAAPKDAKPEPPKDAKPAAPKDVKPEPPKDVKPEPPKDVKPEPPKDVKPVVAKPEEKPKTPEIPKV